MWFPVYRQTLKRLVEKKKNGSKLSNIKLFSTEEFSGDVREMHNESLP